MQILKLGGSAITRKGGYKSADRASIARLARAVSAAWKLGVRDLVLVHGAGSFGHALVLKYKIKRGVRTKQQKKGCKLTQAACAKLSQIVASALRREGVPAFPIAPHSLVVSRGGRIAKFRTAPVFGCIKGGRLPVLYGDMVPDSKLGHSVCSGDQIVAFLGKKAKRIILATDVDGVLANGKLVKEISGRNFKRILPHIRGSGSPDVTGGMAGKIAELAKVSAPSYVVNAKKPKRVLSLLLGKKALGTKIEFKAISCACRKRPRVAR